MAIWPFGRKSKRHSVQLPEAAAAQALQEVDSGSRHSFDALLVRKPSRKPSKRRKEGHLQPAHGISESDVFHEAAPSLEQTHAYPLDTRLDFRIQKGRVDDFHSQSSAKQGDTGPSLLRRKSSKRKANDVEREQQVRVTSTLPIDIQRRYPRTATGEQFPIETARRTRAVSKRSERQLSALSLSMRDSAASSMTDISESYTFKVNAFAAWTPRPIIRYVASSRAAIITSRNDAAPSDPRDKWPVLPISENDLYSEKRVEELADDLDAGALRELLERDRRRRERRRLDEQEALHRKLQRRAERQRQEELQRHETDEEFFADQRGRPPADVPAGKNSFEEKMSEGPATLLNSRQMAKSGSWLRDPSKEGHQNARESSVESVHVIGNIDDSSIPEKKSAQRNSIAMSQHTVSSTRSPLRPELGSPNNSQICGISRDSMSDMSRTIDSERRLSDQSSRRMSSLASFFRRGSSHLKRRYRERSHNQSSDLSTISHESFFKVPTFASGPASSFGPKTFLRPGTISRPQSKFIEHLGDEPISPPDSRLQSPDIPETIPDQTTPTEEHGYRFDVDDEPTDFGETSQYPDSDLRHLRSWATTSSDGGPVNLPFAQSLASVDSEGSWMSGAFLRRIAEKSKSTVCSIGSIANRLEEESQEESRNPEAVVGDNYFARLTPMHGDMYDSYAGTRRPSSSAIGDTNDSLDDDLNLVAGAEEPRRGEVGRRPVIVTVDNRPQSNVAPLNYIESMTPVSADEDSSPAEDDTGVIRSATSVELGTRHARQISARSVRLLNLDRGDSESKSNDEIDSHDTLF